MLPCVATGAKLNLHQSIIVLHALFRPASSSHRRKQKLLLTYQQTIQQAFRGVSDSLVGYQKNHEFREYQEQLAVAAQDAARLSELRYRGGPATLRCSLMKPMPSMQSWA
jgi:hypothetical protein